MAIAFASGSSQYAICETNVPSANSDYTICGWVYFDSVASGYIFGSKGAFGTAYDALEIIYFSSSGQPALYAAHDTSNTSANFSSTVTTGTWYHLAITRSSSTVTAYLDGVSQCSVTLDISSGERSATQDWRIAASWDGAQYCSLRAYGFKWFGRALTAAQLGDERYKVMPVDGGSVGALWSFVPGAQTVDWSGNGRTLGLVNTPTDTGDPPGITWNGEVIVGVPTASSGAMTGTAAFAFGSTGTIRGDGALTGTGAVAFGASSTLTGTGALTGTSAFAFAAPGTIQGLAPITGTAGFSFSAPDATLQGVGALTGTTPFAFSSTSTLTGTGALTGTTPLAFTATGTLDGTSMSGTAAFAFGASGTLTGSGALTGTGAFAFAATGSLGSSSSSVVTYGQWSDAVMLPAGSEWQCRMSFPSCDAPRTRIVLDFIYRTPSY